MIQLANPQWITEDQALADICSELSDQEIAIDTEFTRRTTYYSQLALIQIAAGEKRILIDPLCIEDWAPMRELLTNSKDKIFHAALEDIEVFRSDVGAIPAVLFDTQIAAAFCGLGDSLSYAALVELLCGVQLGKAETQSDWMVRPLSASQIGYAVDDIEWLQQVKVQLLEKLESTDKLGWMQDYCRRTVQSMQQETVPEIAYLRLKGAGRLAPSQLNVAAHLCTWREISARKLDKPKSWIVRDPVILEVARNAPQSTSDLQHRCGMAPESVRRYGRQFLGEIEVALNSVESVDELPNPIDSGQRVVLKKLQKKVEQLALENNMANRLIASKSDLEGLIRWKAQDPAQKKPKMLQDWRSDSFAPILIAEAE